MFFLLRGNYLGDSSHRNSSKATMSNDEWRRRPHPRVPLTHTITHTHTKRIQTTLASSSPFHNFIRTSPPILSMHHPCMLSCSLKSHGSSRCVCTRSHRTKRKSPGSSFCKVAMASTSIRSHRSRSHTPCCHSHASRSRTVMTLVTCTHACIKLCGRREWAVVRGSHPGRPMEHWSSIEMAWTGKSLNLFLPWTNGVLCVCTTPANCGMIRVPLRLS